VAITGASGSIYGLRLVEELLRAGRSVHLVVSDWGQKVAAMETGRAIADWRQDWLAAAPASRLTMHDPADLAAAVSSGSYRLGGTVVAPCSTSSLGAIASGAARNLVHRAAGVALKEGWPLILVPRETPLSLIDLRNLTSLAEAGAVILPAMPGFYHRPRGIDDLVNHVVGKILNRLGIEHKLFEPWDGK
jgi:4-hydroxy-3-polyprenylbenzoate decarboxylase